MPHRPNRTFVSNSDAFTAWAPVARELLLERARTYHAVVSEQELADAVQAATDIAADQPADTWIGKLLERVARDAEKREEPPIAAICLRAEDSFADSAARLEVYRAYATDLPEDGGHPAPVARTSAAVRARSTRTAAPRVDRAPKPPVNQMREVTCTSCWMIVPAREVCTSCGEPLPA